jgi:hypothetical protein
MLNKSMPSRLGGPVSRHPAADGSPRVCQILDTHCFLPCLRIADDRIERITQLIFHAKWSWLDWRPTPKLSCWPQMSHSLKLNTTNAARTYPASGHVVERPRQATDRLHGRPSHHQDGSPQSLKDPTQVAATRGLTVHKQHGDPLQHGGDTPRHIFGGHAFPVQETYQLNGFLAGVGERGQQNDARGCEPVQEFLGRIPRFP